MHVSLQTSGGGGGGGGGGWVPQSPSHGPTGVHPAVSPPDSQSTPKWQLEPLHEFEKCVPFWFASSLPVQLPLVSQFV